MNVLLTESVHWTARICERKNGKPGRRLVIGLDFGRASDQGLGEKTNQMMMRSALGNLCRVRVKLLVTNEQQNQKKDQYSDASEDGQKEENGRKEPAKCFRETGKHTNV
jgi:hypothetical protein